MKQYLPSFSFPYSLCRVSAVSFRLGGVRRLFFLLILLLWAHPLLAKRPKVALVLGGGGAKGAAEVGVLKYIEKSGVPIDLVVGTSIGSIVGGLYCSGVSTSQMESLFLRQDWISLFTDRNTRHSSDFLAEENGVYYVFGFPLYNSNRSIVRDGMLRGDSITSLLGRLCGHTEYMHFDNLKIPFRCVSVDLHTMKEVVHDRGVLPECMRASMSIPLAFTTVNQGTNRLIDGGALNNLPVDVAKQLGADIVIAVDLSQDGSDAETASDSWGSSIVNAVTDFVGQFDLGPIANWVVRRPDNKRYQQNLKMVDVYIHPDLSGYNVASFTQSSISEMIRIGERAGKEALSELNKLRWRVYTNATGVSW